MTDSSMSSHEMTDIQAHAQDLRSMHAARDADFDKYERMFLMTWAKEKAKDPRYQNMMLTESTSARDRVLGAVRLMVATDPTWAVVGEGEGSDKIEKAMDKIWQQAGRAARCPIHYDLITAALLYGEMVGAISPTADLLSYLNKGKPEDETARKYWKANIANAERLAETTPFIVESWNPRNGYPEFGLTDITAYYRCVQTTVKRVRDMYGKCPGHEDSLPNAPVTLNVFYDQVYCAVWTDGGLVYMDEHKLPTIPIMVQIVDGSNLFHEPEYQRQPLLYGLSKSGLWDSENLMLTVIYTNALAMGSKPKYLHTAPATASGKIAQFDYTQDVIEMDAGEQFAPLPMNLIDPSFSQAYQLAVQKGEQATIFSQALGAPADKNTTFSEVTLLSQAGRLPLIGTQRRGGWGIGAAGEKMLLMMRENSEYLRGTDLKKGDIPAGIQLDAKLEVKLPQDKLQQANIASILTRGDNPIVSNDWVLENILGEGQPSEMRKAIWNEKTAAIMFQQALAQMVQQGQQAQQQQQMSTQPPQPGQPQPQGQPPDMGAGPGMAEGQGQMVQGIPPQMAGMMPGAGQGAVPPEGMPQ